MDLFVRHQTWMHYIDQLELNWPSIYNASSSAFLLVCHLMTGRHPGKLRFGLSPGQVDILTQAHLPCNYQPLTHVSTDSIGRQYSQRHYRKTFDIDCDVMSLWFKWPLVINLSYGHHEWTHWPLGCVIICLKSYIETHCMDWYLVHFLQHCNKVNATK